MKQTSEPAVQPRRNLIKALWVSAVALWGSLQLVAGEKKNQSTPGVLKDKEGNETKSTTHDLSQIIGALCLNATLRHAFFKAQDFDAAKRALTDRKLRLSSERPDVLAAVENIYNAHNSPTNTVENACVVLADALRAASVPGCPDWPC